MLLAQNMGLWSNSGALPAEPQGAPALWVCWTGSHLMGQVAALGLPGEATELVRSS